MRQEFDNVFALGDRLRVGREPVLWGFASGLGTGFVVGAFASGVLSLLAPALFPPTQPRTISPAAIASGVGSLAAGLVFLRAGGPLAVLLYVLYSLATILPTIPGQQLFCERSGRDAESCRALALYTTTLVDRWPSWAGLAVGVLASGVLGTRPGPNAALRAAGAYSLISALSGFGFALGSLVAPQMAQDIAGILALSAFIQVVAGVLAGGLLARASASGTILVLLAVLLPAVLAARSQIGAGAAPGESLEIALARWSGVALPVLAAVFMLAARTLERRRAR